MVNLKISQCLDQRLVGVGVIEDGQLRSHLVGEVVELSAGGDRDQEGDRPLLHRKLCNAYGVVDRVQAAAEIEATDGYEASGRGGRSTRTLSVELQ